MLNLLLFSVAMASTDDVDPTAVADIVADIQITASPDKVHEYLLNLSNHADLSPDDCTRRWEMGARMEGVGASATLVYVAPPVWRRALTAVLIEETEQRIVLDHPGDRGFVTTFEFDLQAPVGMTALTMHTWINPPPKPFEGLYYKWIRPHWRDCQERFLTNLAAAVGQ